MDQETPGPAGPPTLTETRPRREAVRAVGAAGAALLGALTVGATADAWVASEKKRKRKRRRPGKTGATGATGATGPAGPTSVAGFVVNRRPGTPFDVAAFSSASGEASCDEGELLLGGGYTATAIGLCEFLNLDITVAGAWRVSLNCSGMSTATAVTPVAYCLAAQG